MNFDYERSYQWPSRAVAGVDEAGRGSWAGPVVAAAVILPSDFDISDLRDSKKLSAMMRTRLAREIRASAFFGIGAASVAEIDRHNILQASLLAMQRALTALPCSASFALIDGQHIPSLSISAVSVVRGDSQVPSIAAASILAKTTRDDIMSRLDCRHPAYGWGSNKGYGTARHAACLAVSGVSRHHRLSFRPIREAIKHL